MEEEKAAAYYDELTRRGEGAARFKQGLGFSATPSSTGNVPARGSALPSSSSASFLSNFVKASSPTKTRELQKQAQLESIQNKLTKKKDKLSPTRDSEQERHQPRVSRKDERSTSRQSRSRDRDRDRDRDRHSRWRSRGRDRYRDGDRDRDRRRRRKRSRNRSFSPRSRTVERRSRSPSPRERRSKKEHGNDGNVEGQLSKARKEKNVDYSKLIEGYDLMSPAERVKAKMKLQLAETAEKDATKGMGSGWERFEFNKDAPLDDEEEVEAAEDDKALVKHIGQSFRFSAVKSKKEEKIRAAHDEAMFGAPVIPSSDGKAAAEAEIEIETNKKELNENDLAANLLSEKVLAKQQGSWRDRARGQRS
ncbi:uncharacterized protein LOC133830432 [Humulus lupulus]|uniref:uncharacterized protein LOC133830432 n=1 Tax=Humulus lupulus TaxID=3486 RepID=UPI002B41002A|nr:uncharacterized protein LOC133830432 [Humulus lupulus]